MPVYTSHSQTGRILEHMDTNRWAQTHVTVATALVLALAPMAAVTGPAVGARLLEEIMDLGKNTSKQQLVFGFTLTSTTIPVPLIGHIPGSDVETRPVVMSLKAGCKNFRNCFVIPSSQTKS